jgi:hypothetical protein
MWCLLRRLQMAVAFDALRLKGIRRLRFYDFFYGMSKAEQQKDLLVTQDTNSMIWAKSSLA